MGQLGFGLDSETGEVVLLTQGKHIINSATFRFQRFVNFQNQVTDLASLKVIRVETGSVGYVYRSGKLEILQPGLHLVSPPDRYGNILTTQQQTLTLPETVHESSDYVPLLVKADVFYCIKDPLKALTRIRDIIRQVRETSIAAVASIIRTSSLSDIAGGTSTVSYKRKNERKGEASAPPFYQHVHDAFMQELHDHVLEDWGIEIGNIRIESLKINDRKLAKDISQQAVEMSKADVRYKMLQKQTDIVTVESGNEANKMRIVSEAKAAMTRVNAEAEAQALLIIAKAQKEAKIMQGEAESRYAEMLGKTELGKQTAVLKFQAEALKGLKSIAYVPHLPGLLTKSGIFADGSMLMPKNVGD